MHVFDISVAASPDNPGCTRYSACVRYDAAGQVAETLWFDLPTDVVAVNTSRADPWVAALLPLASKLGEDLSVDAPLDPMLRDGFRELMEWWRHWFPQMRVVAVRTTGTSPTGTNRSRSAQFFSGGVDSFFTLLRHSGQPESEVEDLLVGWGFDIPLSDRAAFENVRHSLDRVAQSLGKRLVPFATNLRQTRFGREIPWGTIGHGSAMAATALLTSTVYGRMLIPSTDGYRETGPWGSHPTTDHYYSSTSMRVIHDGAAYSRLEKVRLIARSPSCLSALRVCWRGQSDVNCGSCEKCLRTMIALELCGGLENAITFPSRSLDLKTVRRIFCPREKEGSLQLYYVEMRDEAIRQGRLPLARAITSAMRRSGIFRILIYCADRLSFAPGIRHAARRAASWLRASVIV